MSLPRVVAVAPGSAAARAGLVPGDEILSIDGRRPRDVLEWHSLTDEADLELELRRGGLEQATVVAKGEGEPLGVEVDAALFDQVRTCDNHCEFCFIYQLPAGMRPSLYTKDDDYRLSFLYGNFTTLTRFTELDLERVVTEGLSPLYVSIHATDPELRSRMLRNRRGATSLRWLRALLDHGIEVHGQVVVCPGVNDGEALHHTMAGVLDRFPELASVGVVPLGVSRHSHEPAMRPHTTAEAAAVVDMVEDWQDQYRALLGRRLVFAADEYYLLAGRPFPEATRYDGYLQHENGVGMARSFEDDFLGNGPGQGPGGEPDQLPSGWSRQPGGFFSWVDGAPATGYRAPRQAPVATGREVAVTLGPSRRSGSSRRPVTIITGEYGARVIGPLVSRLGRHDVGVLPVANQFFGGNIAVTGLLVGADVAAALADQPRGHRFLLPDVCLSKGVFLDGFGPADLPRPVEVIATEGSALRRALDL